MERALQVGERSELFGVLADGEVRDVLSRLRARDGTVSSLDDLAADCPTDGGTEATALRLHHVILPKLAAADILRYDPEAKTVRYRGHEAAEMWLDRIDEAEL